MKEIRHRQEIQYGQPCEICSKLDSAKVFFRFYHDDVEGNEFVGLPVTPLLSEASEITENLWNQALTATRYSEYGIYSEDATKALDETIERLSEISEALGFFVKDEMDHFENNKQPTTIEGSTQTIINGEKDIEVRTPLSPNAQIVYDILINLPAHKALKTPEIINEVYTKTEKNWDEKELYGRVYPQLRSWGLKNKRRVGYWVEKQ